MGLVEHQVVSRVALHRKRRATDANPPCNWSDPRVDGSLPAGRLMDSCGPHRPESINDFFRRPFDSGDHMNHVVLWLSRLNDAFEVIGGISEMGPHGGFRTLRIPCDERVNDL